MPLFFDDFPNVDLAREFIARVKQRYGLEGSVHVYKQCSAKEEDFREAHGECLGVTIERPCSGNARYRAKVERKINKLAEELGVDAA